jgi:6-phospho-beta-glucosidase
VKLLLLGAGIRTPLLLQGLIRRQLALNLSDVVLYDDDFTRLATMGAFARAFGERHGACFTISHTIDLAEAASDAQFIFSAIRVGQERNRILDERVPLSHGVVGQETTGPGGFAMALRTIPVLLNYARTLEAVAPDAWFVNFTNPAGLITQALLDHTRLRVVGICDTPPAMRASLARFLRQPEDEIFLDYFGLNHLGWVRRVLVDDQDMLPDILDRYEALASEDREWALFEPELVRFYGMLPNEYLYYYYYREHAVANILTSGSTRGEQILGINEPLWRELGQLMAAGRVEDALQAYNRGMTSRDQTYMARESGRFARGSEEETGTEEAEASVFAGEGYAGQAMAVMAGIVHGEKAPLVLNVSGQTSWGELAPNDVIETPSVVDQHGPHPLAQAPMPESVRPLITAIKAYERLTIEAAVMGSYAAAVQALTIHPLVMSYSLARCIVDEYLQVHRAFLPQFTA